MNKFLTSKFLTFSLFAFTFLSSFAADPGDVMLTFSTKGPDKYMDNSAVLDGECYAVVWTKSDATFGGFAANGTLVSATDKLVVVAGLAKGACCPTTLFLIPKAEASQYENGTFALYLLDTRMKDAAGKVTVGGAGLFAQTAPAAVNAAGAAETATIAGSGTGGSVAAGAVALGEVGTYTKLDDPKITGIEIGDATITLKVDGLEPTADYFVVPGSQPNLFEPKPATPAVPVDGKLTVEKKDGASFFKVVGARKFE